MALSVIPEFLIIVITESHWGHSTFLLLIEDQENIKIRVKNAFEFEENNDA